MKHSILGLSLSFGLALLVFVELTDSSMTHSLSLVSRHSLTTFQHGDEENASGQLIQQPPKAAPRRADVGANYPNSNQRMHYTVLQAFREAIGNNWMSTVRVLSGGKMVALGTIVDSNGWIVSKSSEIAEEAVECRLYDGSRVAAKVLARRSDVDLVLLKIDKSGLQPVEWTSETKLPIGTWLASTDLKSYPGRDWCRFRCRPKYPLRANRARHRFRLDAEGEFGEYGPSWKRCSQSRD